LYEVDNDRLLELPVEKFAALKMYEREDLQRLLRSDISPLGDDLLVVAEEFGQWDDARRRIDLLAVDTAGRLVVIELKRTETGGHMDLQAIRYASMVLRFPPNRGGFFMPLPGW
jgi:RecB family endonuclease NucS